MIPGGGNSPAWDAHHGPSQAAGCCWLCGYAVIDPPLIIGQRHAGQIRIAHRYCLRVLGELDLDLPPVL
jgi:hypothetical protein